MQELFDRRHLDFFHDLNDAVAAFFLFGAADLRVLKDGRTLMKAA